MKRVTLDASVAIAWLMDEERPAWVDRLIDEARAGTLGLAVPSLFWMELGNRLSRDQSLTDDQAVDGLLRFESLGAETVELERPLRIRALQLAREQRLTMYDGAYLALAHALDAPLATLDRRLESAAAALGIGHRHGSHHTSEEQAAYGQEADLVSVAAIGAALAELRSRYQSGTEDAA